MAEETTLLVCGKCGAKLRVKTGLLKVMRTVKCSRCGTAVPTKPAPGAAAPPPAATPPEAEPPAPAPAPPTAETPAPAPATAAAPVTPAPAAPPPPAPPPTPPPAAPTPTPPAPPAPPAPPPPPVSPPAHSPAPAAPKPHPAAESVPIPVVSQAALAAAGGNGALSGPPTTVADELRKSRGRIQELELRVNSLLEQGALMTEARSRIARLETELAEAKRPHSEVPRLRREVEEQAARITELQQLWMSKEKEVREAQDLASRAERARLQLRTAVSEMLRTYHASEVASAQQRLHELESRVSALLDAASPPP